MTTYTTLIEQLLDQQEQNKKWFSELTTSAQEVIAIFAYNLGLNSDNFGELIHLDEDFFNECSLNLNNQYVAKFVLDFKLDDKVLDTVELEFLVMNNTDGIAYYLDDSNRWTTSQEQLAQYLITSLSESLSFTFYELS